MQKKCKKKMCVPSGVCQCRYSSNTTHTHNNDNLEFQHFTPGRAH
jgi:hypothetical protein